MSENNGGKPPVNWEEIEAQPAFRELLAKKNRFIIASTIFFMVYYFALLVLEGWFPDVMKKQILGKLNVAYLFALSQFFMAWALAFVYTRRAAEWDKTAAQIIINK